MLRKIPTNSTWLLILLFPILEISGEEKTPVDTFEDSLILRPAFFFNTLSLHILDEKKYPDAISYMPNTRYLVGLDFLYKNLGIGGSFKLPGAQRNEGQYGSTSSTDYKLYYYGRRIGAEIFYQDYRNFYTEIPNVSPYSIRDDFRVSNMGINGYYAFSGDFSLGSAMRQTERQNSATFSFILGANLSYFAFSGAGSILPENREADFGKYAGLSRGHYTNVFILPGIGINLVSRDSLFLSFIGLIGSGLTNAAYETSSGTVNKLVNNLKVNVRGTIGINHERFLAGMTVVIDMTTVDAFGDSKLSVRTIAAYAELFAGLRF